MQEKSFLEEQNELFEKFILNDFYATFDPKRKKHTKIEIDITPDCNKKCEYCYLQKYKDDLYPVEIRDKKVILKNLELFLKFLHKKNVRVEQIQLFSGEIWGTSYCFEIFDVLLANKIEDLTESIMIPSNCSFVNDEKQLAKINEYIIQFLLRKVRIAFSASYDGYIVENINRPFNDEKIKLEKDYTNKLFHFIKNHNTGFHPMIAAGTIEKQIENFNWWASECEKIGWNPLEKVMMLEVRNDDWTDEKIKTYLEWLFHITKYAFNNIANKNQDDMLQLLLGENEDIGQHYVPFILKHEKNRISCNLVHHHTVRLGDLAIIPCHRLSYEKLIYGKYKVENDEIVGVEALNINFALQNYLLNNSGYLKCDQCPISEICPGQCHGATFEKSKEAFYPIESVCNLEKAKLVFILLYLEKLVRKTGFLEKTDLKGARHLQKRVKSYLDRLNQLRLMEEYEKWIKMAEMILSEI